MKAFMGFLFLVLAGLGSRALAATPDFLATVSGTISYTVNLPSSGNDIRQVRIQTVTITNAKLYAEFGVLSGNYALVMSRTDQALEFVPRSASSGLSKVVVFSEGSAAAIAIQGSTGVEKFQDNLTSSTDADGTYFQATTGLMVGKILNKPSSLADSTSLVGLGWDYQLYAVGYTGNSSNPTAPIKMHVTTGAAFTQQP
ncbi:MAG: hypothetical protein QM796_01250 [Chthoniobacteraceae bacterium]